MKEMNIPASISHYKSNINDIIRYNIGKVENSTQNSATKSFNTQSFFTKSFFQNSLLPNNTNYSINIDYNITIKDKEDPAYSYLKERVKISKMSFGEKKYFLNQIVFTRKNITDDESFKDYVRKMTMLILLKEVTQCNTKKCCNCKIGCNRLTNAYERFMLDKYVERLEKIP